MLNRVDDNRFLVLKVMLRDMILTDNPQDVLGEVNYSQYCFEIIASSDIINETRSIGLSRIYIYKEECLSVCYLCIWTRYDQMQ